MIKNKKLIIGILLTVFFIIANTTISLGITYDNFKPQITGATNAIDLVEKILSVMLVIGIIATVVLLAIIGFTSIIGSASEKAAAQEKYMGFVLGAILITSISAVAKFIISIAENMV